MALIGGDARFDRLFAGIRFDEVDGDMLNAFAKDEETAAELKDNFALPLLHYRERHSKARNRYRIDFAEAVDSMMGTAANSRGISGQFYGQKAHGMPRVA
jgi:hypothetical protein